jgi:hypothetical protein
MTPGQVKRRSGQRLATSGVLLVAAVAAVSGACGASGVCSLDDTCRCVSSVSETGLDTLCI